MLTCDRLRGEGVEVRSNWRTCVQQVNDVWGAMGGEGGNIEVVGTEEEPITAFERKYRDVGEACYRVWLR